MRQQHHHHPVSCQFPPTSAMTSEGPTHHWLPQHDPEPATEVLSGDLYLLTTTASAGTECRSNRSSNSSGSSSDNINSSSSSSSSINNCKNNKRIARSGGVTWVRCSVHVQIYRSCFGHYAVVSANLRAPATFLNLRFCNARPCCGSSDCSPSSSSSSSSSSSTSSSPFLSTTTTFSPSSSSSSSSSDDHLEKRFRVELGGGEGQVIYFEVSPPSSGAGDCGVSVEEWVRAFQSSGGPSSGTLSPSHSPVIPRNPIMPTLQESIEEEEEEEEEEEGQEKGDHR